MHLIVDKTRDEVVVVQTKAWYLHRQSPIRFSSKLGQFVVRMAYARAGTVEYV